jgi:hypothetical protein
LGTFPTVGSEPVATFYGGMLTVDGMRTTQEEIGSTLFILRSDETTDAGRLFTEGPPESRPHMRSKSSQRDGLYP